MFNFRISLILVVCVSQCLSQDEHWFENSIINLAFYADKRNRGEVFTEDDVISSPTEVEETIANINVAEGPNPFVQTTSGMVEGITTADSHVFYGIPYAVPPVGELRFKSPQQLDDPSGIVDGTKNSEVQCEQFESSCLAPCPFLNMQEDCLILNVFVPPGVNLSDPTAQPDSRLDVLFYIHGGSFLHGKSTSTSLDGRWLANAAGHIIVTINYRLGPWGFLALKEGGNEISGKQGMEDMIMALKWTRNNIANFGGNPDSVTIFGNSAGAQACMLLLLDDEADPYFNRIIMQSNPAVFPYPTPEESYEMTNRLTRFMNCSDNETQYECLMNSEPRRINIQEPKMMLSSLLRGEIWNMVEPYRPVMRFNDQPLALFRDGIWQSHKQVIIGTNTGECDHAQEILKLLPLGFSYPAYTLMNSIFMGDRELGQKVTDQYAEWYAEDDGYARAAAEQMTHVWFVCPSRAMARVASVSIIDPGKHIRTVWPNQKSAFLQRFSSNTTSEGGGVFLYSYGHPREGDVCVNSTDISCGYATHAAEVKFVFRSGPYYSYEFSADDYFVADQFTSYWGRHASYGDPSSELGSGEEFADWPPYEEGGFTDWTNIVIDSENVRQQGYLEEVCDFWDSLDFYVDMPGNDDTTSTSSTTTTSTTSRTTSTVISTTDDAHAISPSLFTMAIVAMFVSWFV